MSAERVAADDDDEPAKPPPPPPCACCSAPSKYRCPACDARTCSLACVNKHKAETKCSGIRNAAAYKPIQAFDDAALAHDYRFLEDAIRAVDSSKRRKRDIEQQASPAPRHNTTTPARQTLAKQARDRGIRLELMPSGMQKQRENTTRYDGRRRQLIWRIELRFSAAGVLHVLSGVPESVTVLRLLRYMLEPDVPLTGDVNSAGGGSGGGGGTSASRKDPDGQRALLRHKLRAYCKEGASSLRVFLFAEGRRADDPRYHELPLESSLCEALKGKTVIEYPTLHIALASSSEDEGVPTALFPLVPPEEAPPPEPSQQQEEGHQGEARQHEATCGASSASAAGSSGA